MKRPLEWHKECLRNSESYERRERAAAERAAESVRALALRNAVYREQIRRAEAEGRDGFDADKFNKRKI